MNSRTKLRTHSSIVGAALVLLGAQSAAAQVAVPNNTYELRSVQSGLCLDVDGAHTNPGANVQQWTCVHDPQQLWRADWLYGNTWTLTNINSSLYLQVVGNMKVDGPEGNIQQGAYSDGQSKWEFVNKGAGQFQLRSTTSGKCMEVATGIGDSANVYQKTCSTVPNQLWQFVLTEQDQTNNTAYFTYEMRPAHTRNMCLTVAGALPNPEVNVEQDYCTSDLHQYWMMKDVQNSDYFYLVNDHSNLCLDVDEGATHDRANVQQYYCDPAAPQQRWKPQYVGDALFEMVNEKSGKCLDVSGAGTRPETNVQLWSCAGVPQQYWEMIVTSF